MKSTSNTTVNSEHWWKIQEASIIALSLTKDIVVEQQQAGDLRFDVVRFLVDVVLTSLNDSGNHYKMSWCIISILRTCDTYEISYFLQFLDECILTCIESYYFNVYHEQCNY